MARLAWIAASVLLSARIAAVQALSGLHSVLHFPEHPGLVLPVGERVRPLGVHTHTHTHTHTRGNSYVCALHLQGSKLHGSCAMLRGSMLSALSVTLTRLALRPRWTRCWACAVSLMRL
jgi:hypothetical protein